VNLRHWLAQAQRADAAVYAAVARTNIPALDRAMRRLSSAADYSKPWIGAAGLLAVAGGDKGRRAAAEGLAAIAVTAAVVNVAIKPIGRRRRPVREAALPRHVRMPLSRSFPSGHTAAGFAFATGVGATLPRLALPLRMVAGLVGYSRVHTGVHYPGDVVSGALLGVLFARLTTRAGERRRS
jgi:membrane-associated phospholipid phosphatase